METWIMLVDCPLWGNVLLYKFVQPQQKRRRSQVWSILAFALGLGEKYQDDNIEDTLHDIMCLYMILAHDTTRLVRGHVATKIWICSLQRQSSAAGNAICLNLVVDSVYGQNACNETLPQVPDLATGCYRSIKSVGTVKLLQGIR